MEASGNAEGEGGDVFPGLLASAVDLSKTRRGGSLPVSKGLAFLHLLVLIGAQLLSASRPGKTSPPSAGSTFASPHEPEQRA